MSSLSRRGFLKSGATAGAAVGLSGLTGVSEASGAEDTARVPGNVSGPGGSMIGVPFKPRDEVKVPDFTRGQWQRPRDGIDSPRPTAAAR